jgi:hypothetical protein
MPLRMQNEKRSVPRSLYNMKITIQAKKFEGAALKPRTSISKKPRLVRITQSPVNCEYNKIFQKKNKRTDIYPQVVPQAPHNTNQKLIAYHGEADSISVSSFDEFGSMMSFMENDFRFIAEDGVSKNI